MAIQSSAKYNRRMISFCCSDFSKLDHVYLPVSPAMKQLLDWLATHIGDQRPIYFLWLCQHSHWKSPKQWVFLANMVAVHWHWHNLPGGIPCMLLQNMAHTGLICSGTFGFFPSPKQYPSWGIGHLHMAIYYMYLYVTTVNHIIPHLNMGCPYGVPLSTGDGFDWK